MQARATAHVHELTVLTGTVGMALHGTENGNGARCDHDDKDELRCGCGRLVARWLGRRLEIRCPRCKRTIPIAWEGAPTPRVP